MATDSDAMAVKSFNKSSGGNRYKYKTPSQKLQDIDINVYHSLEPLKAEPSEGSSFFRDCLVEYRELNTAEDFISFYEEILPLAQTHAQIILHKEMIISSLLSRLQLTGRLSLEPILRLIAALSRDLLEDFIPFLQRIVDSLRHLLESGGDKDDEIIKQIFTSWSDIMMYLQKYLTKDVSLVLRITAKIRYYPRDYVQKLMSESVSLLLRNTETEMLKSDIIQVLTEVVDEPSDIRKCGVSSLLSHVMRITSLKLHSKAGEVLSILLDVQSVKGSDTVLEVVILTFQKLWDELDSKEVNFTLKILEKITDCANNGNSSHLIHLMAILISTVQDHHLVKKLVREPSLSMAIVQEYVRLVDLLVQKYVTPSLSMDIVDQRSEIIDKILNLILCVLEFVSKTKNTSVLPSIASHWGQIFDLRSQSLLTFINDLRKKAPYIFDIFGTNIISSFDNLIEISEEETVHLMLNVCENLKGQRFSSSDGKLSRIHVYFEETLQNFNKIISDAVKGNPFFIPNQSLAIVWGVIGCYCYYAHAKTSPAILMDVINQLDELLMLDSNFAGFPQNTWQVLIGAALRSYHKLVFSRSIAHDEAMLTKFLDLAKRHKSSPQILSAVADILDSTAGSKFQEDGNVLDALEIFNENLCNVNKEIRLSTLRILCHYEPLQIANGNKSNNVLDLLRSIEATPHSTDTERKVISMISNIQMSLNANRVAEQYVPAVLSGIIGIFHNSYTKLWQTTSECISVLIEKYFRLLWDHYVKYVGQCQSIFLKSSDQCGGSINKDSKKDTGLVGRFNSSISPVFDSTSCATVLSLLIKSLEKVSTLVESRNHRIVTLFLEFMGYNVGELTSVASYTLDHERKEWNRVLEEWLTLFTKFQNPTAFYQSKFVKDVLQYRLLDANDPDTQEKVLDCLLTWKDDFLLPYRENLKNLINAKSRREDQNAKTLSDELTSWSLSSKSMNCIDTKHRPFLVPVVIRILLPKVINLRTQKDGSVSLRKKVLGFLAQLDVDELDLFFWLLVEPIISIPQTDDKTRKYFWTTSDISNVMKNFTIDTIQSIPWNKKSGFLHVLKEIFANFNDKLTNPSLDLLTNCVVRILSSCTSSPEKTDEVMDGKTANKDLRSLCLKIINQILAEYADHDFGETFWELFFTSLEPLIANFRQEGASSKNPSSLFSCFLAMSKNERLVPLLAKKNNLVPDIFSILTVPSASEEIVSNVLRFIKNLLELDSKLIGEGNCVRRILISHMDVLIGSLHTRFTRKSVKIPGEEEFTIFSLLSKYVKSPSVAETFVDILLPFLTKPHQKPDDRIHILQIIKQVVTVLGSGNSKRILNSVTPLLITADLSVRISICDVLDALAANDSSLITVATVLRELISFSAYENVSVGFFSTVPEDHALAILAHAIHDMSSEEWILRDSALKLLQSFIKFSAEILNGGMMNTEQFWTEASVKKILNDFILKQMGSAMNKAGAGQKVWMDVLREMVLELPNVAYLDSYRALCSDDAEQDFFNNILHLQKHRRARALSRFSKVVTSGNLSKVITNKVFVPLFYTMLLDLQTGRDEHVRSGCLNALAAISGGMNWNQYYALLRRCCQEMTQKEGKQKEMTPQKQKLLLRLISSILDHFHFTETNLIPDEPKDDDAPDPYSINTSTLNKCTGSRELSAIQTCLQKNLLPNIKELLSDDSDNVHVNVSLVVLKLLKLLPGEIMELQLPSIVHRVCNFLKHRLESVRDEARSALAAILKELGLGYLQFIVKALKGTLKRGYELHVLGFSLHFMLSKFLNNPVCGKLDYCLEDLLSVVENDILGDVSEQKEVEKIASKMKETRKQKSYETLKLIAQSITFKTHALKLLSPVTVHLQKHLTQKTKTTLEKMLSEIAAGIECNPSVDRTELFIFTFGLIEDGIRDENNEILPSRISLVSVNRQYSHMITGFALVVLQNYMKNLKLNRKDEELMSMLDPFVALLGRCITSKYENITTAALKCLSPLLMLPLPSLQPQAEQIKNSLLCIAQGLVRASSHLTESCIKLLTVLLRSTRVTLSTDQLHMLVQFPLFDDLANNPSFMALSLLKAIVKRQLVVPRIYDLVQDVVKLMVQSQQETIQIKCRQILLQFLMGYHLSKKRLQQHLDILLTSLSYEHSSGIESVLEMLHDVIMNFPRNFIDEQSHTFFVKLVVCLANDKDRKVRSLAAAAIECLIGHLSQKSLDSVIDFTRSWYLGNNPSLWGAAAEVLGLLVEVVKESFSKHLCHVLPVTRTILQSALTHRPTNADDADTDPDELLLPFRKEVYYSLVMFDKIIRQFPNLCFEKEIQDMWEAICEFILYPHLRIRNIANSILSLYFAAVSNASREVPIETFFLMKPSRLFLTAVSFCCQLKKPFIDDADESTLMVKNLVFSICGIHSILVKNGGAVEAQNFWSNLELADRERIEKAFALLDKSRGRRMLHSFISGDINVQQTTNEHPFVSYLLNRMGTICFEEEEPKMKIVILCFKFISPTLLGGYRMGSPVANDDPNGYTYKMLLPLYKICEGFAGKEVSDDLKQLGQEARDSIRDIIGMQNFVQVYSLIRKNTKGKRDKRNQDLLIMKVVNPERNAKRKLRIAAKHRTNKRRKIMNMKVGRMRL